MNLTFGNKLIKQVEDQWYNLETGRQLKNPRAGFWFLKNPRVAGPQNLIEQFILENKLSRSDVLKGYGDGQLPSEESKVTIEVKAKDEGPKPPSYPPPSEAVKAVMQRSFKARSPRMIDIGLFGPIKIEPKPEIKQIEIGIEGVGIEKKLSCSLEPIQGCSINKAGSFIYHPNSTEIEDIPPAQFDNLCNFSLLGLKTKIRLHEVIDGDTFEVAFFCPIQELAQPIITRRRGGLEEQTRAFCFAKDVGFFLKMKCRLWGVDSAEHDTLQGVLAKVLVNVLAERYNRIFWANFKEFDKYGRPLIEIFFDKERTKTLGKYLVDHKDSELGPIAVEYFGDEKSQYMKTLKTISLAEQKEAEKKYLERTKAFLKF